MSGPARRPGAESFPKEARLRRRREFLEVQRRGRRTPTASFLLVHTRSEAGSPARLGITVTRRVGGAVTRNRIKRSVREVFRRCRRELPDGLEVVVIARDRAAGLTPLAVADELRPALLGVAARSPDGGRKDAARDAAGGESGRGRRKPAGRS